jgi:hypothetical protein
MSTVLYERDVVVTVIILILQGYQLLYLSIHIITSIKPSIWVELSLPHGQLITIFK